VDDEYVEDDAVIRMVISGLGVDDLLDDLVTSIDGVGLRRGTPPPGRMGGTVYDLIVRHDEAAAMAAAIASVCSMCKVWIRQWGETRRSETAEREKSRRVELIMSAALLDRDDALGEEARKCKLAMSQLNELDNT
jgi:hypothetical protein